MNVVKAEILWSRSCPLSCSYCAMADGRRNSVTFEQWAEGFIQLKKLGCSLGAFYGAEPLHDFDKLPEVVGFAEGLGIHTTVITSGVTDNLYDKLKTLYNAGLRSITTSYDASPLDSSSEKKSSKALEVIDIFRSFGTVRDSAVVVTLTRKNYALLPQIIIEMSRMNIWTFFDLIHPDRGQAGSKVKNTDLDLLFTKEDFPLLIEVLTKIMELKERGFLCHTSKQFVETIKIVAAYTTTLKNFKPVDPYLLWNCAAVDCFPSFVTVDVDASVFCCDDFQPKNHTLIKIWEIYDLWDKFCTEWKPVVRKECPGCLWSTHLDAHLIKEGQLPITDYIHGT